MRLFRPLVPATMMVLTLLARPAGATVFCVATGNELATALETAAFNGVNDEIRIRTGTLTRAGASGVVPRWQYAPGFSGDTVQNLNVSGGWTSCSAQVDDPNETVLDAQYQGAAINFSIPRNSGTLRIANLTVTRGYSGGAALAGDGQAANLGIHGDDGTFNLTVERLIVIAGRADTSGIIAGGIAVIATNTSAATITVRNNVVAYNNALVDSGISINADGSTVMFTNNSIFSNAASNSAARGAGLDLRNDLGSSYMANNVLYQNRVGGGSIPDYEDFQNLQGSSYLRNNHIGRANMTNAPVINLGATTGNPNWTLVGVYPVPNTNSLLRDSGYNSAIGGTGSLDLSGGTRVVNGTVDRGAIEADAPALPDAVFANGFE